MNNTQVHEVAGHSPAQLLLGETLNFDRFAVSGAKEGVRERTSRTGPDGTSDSIRVYVLATGSNQTAEYSAVDCTIVTATPR